MRIELRRIKRDLYDIMINSINENIDFYKGLTDNISFNGEEVNIENLSEPLKATNNMFIELDEDDLRLENLLKWKQNYELGKLLHRKLNKYCGEYYGLMSEKFFWTYLAHTPLFRKYIYNRFILRDDEDENEDDDKNKAKNIILDKIKRYYFFKSNHQTRIGIKFYWDLTFLLYDENKNYELSSTAFSNIDCVKAIYERSIKKNANIIKAFVQGIINNNKHSAFRDKEYRTIIPTHINNLAAINLLDSYNYNELVKKVTEEQRLFLEQFTNKSTI